MANPLFNVDEIGADKIKSDPRRFRHVLAGLSGMEWEDEEGNTIYLLPEYLDSIQSLRETLAPFLAAQSETTLTR